MHLFTFYIISATCSEQIDVASVRNRPTSYSCRVASDPLSHAAVYDGVTLTRAATDCPWLWLCSQTVCPVEILGGCTDQLHLMHLTFGLIPLNSGPAQ